MFCQLDNGKLIKAHMTTSVEIEEYLWRQSHYPSARSKHLGDKLFILLLHFRAFESEFMSYLMYFDDIFSFPTLVMERNSMESQGKENNFDIDLWPASDANRGVRTLH